MLPGRPVVRAGLVTWLTAAWLRRGLDLQIMFGIGGEHDLSERELPHLAGWRDSRPVRVGNGAWNQRQLDVYGELLGVAPLHRRARTSTARSRGGSTSPRRCFTPRSMVKNIRANTEEP
jgi:hypothetical protein